MRDLQDLGELSEQSKARRRRGYVDPLRIGVGPGLVLEFPKPGKQSSKVLSFYGNRQMMPMLVSLLGRGQYDALMATNPDQDAIDALWELIGIEYDYVDAEGLVRYERMLDRMKTARDEMRKSIDVSTETDVVNEPEDEPTPKQ